MVIQTAEKAATECAQTTGEETTSFVIIEGGNKERHCSRAGALYITLN